MRPYTRIDHIILHTMHFRVVLAGYRPRQFMGMLLQADSPEDLIQYLKAQTGDLVCKVISPI